MAKTRSSTIILQGEPNLKEAPAVATLKAGNIVINSGAGFAKSIVASAGVLMIATEQDLIGKTIDDAIAQDENVTAHVAAKGDVVQIRVPAGASAIAKFALLKRDATGCVITGGVAADVVAEALEAIDNSGGGSEVFINAQIV